MDYKKISAPEAGTSKSGSKNISIDDYIGSILGCQALDEVEAIKYVMGVQLALAGRWINVDFWDYPYNKTATCQLAGKDMLRTESVTKTGRDWLDRCSALKKAVGGLEL